MPDVAHDLSWKKRPLDEALAKCGGHYRDFTKSDPAPAETARKAAFCTHVQVLEGTSELLLGCVDDWEAVTAALPPSSSPRHGGSSSVGLA